MISIIVCSADDMKLKAVEAMYRTAIESPIEFIGIENPASITSGYNRGAASSRGDVLIFSHDDVEVLSPDLEKMVEESLKQYDMVGVAGTTKVVSPQWIGAGPPYIFGQIVHPTDRQGFFSVNIFNAPRRCIAGIQALDGVFLGMRRAVWEKNPFDAKTFDGFHLYDMDFTYSAHLAGWKLCVRNDIHLLHASMGNFLDPQWTMYADRFVKKHEARLPRQALRRHRWAGCFVIDFDEAREIMTPAYWND